MTFYHNLNTSDPKNPFEVSFKAESIVEKNGIVFIRPLLANLVERLKKDR